MSRVVFPHAIVAAVLLISGEATAQDRPWKSIRTEDGLTLETRDVDGSHFEELRVVTVSALPLETLCDAVWGRDARVEGNFKKRVVISESDTDRWTYEQIRVPIVMDRDVVMHSQVIAAASSGRCEVFFQAGTDPAFPKARDHVRIDTLRGRWSLEPTADGKVEITYVVYGEPGGKIPAWMSRGGQRKAAVIFMKIILERAEQ